VSFPRRRVYRLSGGGGRRAGVPRAVGRAVVDDTGGFHPLGLTLMWTLQGLKHEPEHFKANAEWAASKGFDYVRLLTEVAWPGNRRIDPTQPEWSDWRELLGAALDILYDGLGLRTEITIRGKGTASDAIWLAQQVGDIVAADRAHKVLNIETENEYSVGGDVVGTLAAMAGELARRVPNLIALSSPGDAEEIYNESLRLGIKAMTWHSDRGDGDYKWRQVRQPYDFKDYGPLVVSNNEPPGPASSVATNSSPLQLAMMRAVGVMCGGAGFVLHTGTGVYGDGQAHPTAGPRPANFWEIDNIDAIVSAVRGVDALLPEGVENWRVANTQWVPPNPVAPLQPHHHWEGDSGDGVNKAYSALSADGRWVPCGVRGHVRLTPSYPLSDVTVFDPLSLQPVPGFSGRSFGQGEAFDLPGGGQNAMVAYIIHGRR
jgi:hypothetical protein